MMYVQQDLGSGSDMHATGTNRTNKFTRLFKDDSRDARMNVKLKFVAEKELFNIVKKVQREKQREKDKLIQISFQQPNHPERHDSHSDGLYQESLKNSFQGTSALAEPECDPEEAQLQDLPSHSVEIDRHQWRRQDTPCDSTHGTPSLVPTSSEVLIGSNARDGGHCQRIAILKRRIEAALDGVEALLRRRPKEPDGEEEFERCRTRISEFLSRFSRNYLFQLRMQVMDLQRQIQGSSLESPGGHMHHQAVLQKLVAAYQTAVQGLQACLHQLPGALHDSGILSKLDQLVCHVCELTSLESQLDFNANLAVYGDLAPRETMKAKAQNLLQLVRKKKKEREESYLAWKRTAAILAKNRFGPPPGATRARTISRPTSREAKAKDVDRRMKRNFPRKQVSLPTGMEVQRIDTEYPSHQVSAVNLPEIHSEAAASNSPMDPAAALELKIIMSRMKDILRGAHTKALPNAKPTYPPNVRLVCVTHSDDDLPAADQRNNDDTELSEQNIVRDVNEPSSVAEQCDAQESQDGKTQSQSGDLLQLPEHQDLQDTNQSHLSADGPDAYPLRRLTPEELTIIRYRNRFNVYKQRVSEVQQICEEVLTTVFHEVAKELEPSILLDQMYYLELKG